MPAAAPIIIGAVASQAAAGISATIAGAILSSTGAFISDAVFLGLSGVISAGIGGIASMAASSLLTPKAKAQRTGTNSNSIYPYVDNGVKTTERNTVQSRQVIYGQTKVSGTLLLEKLTSSGVNNNGDNKSGRDSYLHQIIAYATHECESFEELYLDDDVLEIDSDGWVLNAKYTTNSDTFTPKAFEAYSLNPYTATNATGTGTTATIYIDLSFATASTIMGAGDLLQVEGFADSAYNCQGVISSIASHAAGAATQVVYTTTSSITTSPISQVGSSMAINPIGYIGTTAYGYNSTGHGLNSGDNVYIYDASPAQYNKDRTSVTDVPTTRTFTYRISSVTSTSQTGTFQRRNGTEEALVNVQKFLGASGQNLGTDADIADLMPDTLTATDYFKGICCVYVRFYDASKFTAAPQLTALIKGAKLYDPRDGSLAYSNNSALVVMDYLTRKIGENSNKPIGVGLHYNTATNASDDLNLDSFSDAADICDEQVTLSTGALENRYTINGVVNLGEQPIDVISLMIPTFQGALTDYNFKINIQAAAYEPAIHHIDETWLIGAVSVELDNDKQNLSNTIRAIFNDEDKEYYPDDMPKYQDATFLAEDNNEELSEDLQLPYVKESERAQRLSKLYLQQRRANRKTLKLQLNAKGCVIAPWDNVSFSYARWNWSNRIYKVISISEGLLNEGVTVIMRPDSTAIYDWDSSEAS